MPPHDEKSTDAVVLTGPAAGATTAKLAGLSLVRLPTNGLPPTKSEELRRCLRAEYEVVTTLVENLAKSDEQVSFAQVEKELRTAIWVLAQAAIMLFLSLREERIVRGYQHRIERGGRIFRVAPAIARNLTTLFGVGSVLADLHA